MDRGSLIAIALQLQRHLATSVRSSRGGRAYAEAEAVECPTRLGPIAD